MKQIIFSDAVSGSPDSPEWHEWRSHGIGGSDAGVIAADAGLCIRATWMPTLTELWERKVGLRAQQKSNPAMQRGRQHEEPARQKYELQTSIMVSPSFGEMDAHPEIRASFDGTTFDELVNVEIKVPSVATVESAKVGDVPGYYLAQLAHQGLVIWGLPKDWPMAAKVHFAAYNPAADELVIVEFDEISVDVAANQRMKDLKVLAEKLLPFELQFWQNVLLRNPPGQSIDEWTVAAHKYRLADEAEARAKETKDAAKDVLMGLVGDSPKRSGAGVTVSTYTQAGPTDYKKLISTVIDRKKLQQYLLPIVPDEQALESLLNSFCLTEDDMLSFKGKESVRTKITLEKDFVAPLQPVIFEPKVSDGLDQTEKGYAW